MDLGEGLRRALAKITGAALVDEKAVKELIKELQRTLISNDVSVSLVFELSKRIEERALREKPLPGVTNKEHVVRVVYDELTKFLGEKYDPPIKPHKILLLGLFGSGKTTTAAKLAHFYKGKGLRPALICCDTQRPAAFDQLQQLAEQLQIPFYGERGERDSAKIASTALSKFKADIIILDSAGRNAFDAELADELKRLGDAFKPDEKLLVISADIGQVAQKQAEQFNSALGLTGVIATKMDGSGKGGGALSAVAASGTKVAFIGSGEKPEDFAVFDARKFVGRLLGFPDLEALLEKVKKISEEQELSKNVLEEKFTIKTFFEQLKAAKKLGPLKDVFGMLGIASMPKELMVQSEEKLKKFEVIINSMTKQERDDVQLLKKNRSRIERIARGSGTTPEDVRELLKQFEQVESMLSNFKKNRGFKRQMEKMMKSGFKMP
ncbi:MAG: signal recognition particle receptor subunit alpha [Candidatus Micrarchaeota archaeon]